MEENNTVIPENSAINEIKICDEVIQSIAAHAVKDTEGVSITEGFVEKFVKKNSYKSIRVEIEDSAVSLDVHVSIEYGLKIPDVCTALQDNIKKNIENITDYTVKTVNICVDGISMEKPSAVCENTQQSDDE